MSDMTRDLAMHDLNELKGNSCHGYADAIDFALSDMEKMKRLEEKPDIPEDIIIECANTLREGLRSVRAERDMYREIVCRIRDSFGKGNKVSKDTVLNIFKEYF